jgi:putative inorganic carbon (HCO3(-)) transporter
MILGPSIIRSKVNPYVFMFSLLFFFTPLLFVGNTNELFEFPKMFFVYAVGGFIVLAFILDSLFNRKKLILPSFPVLLFVLALILSTLFSTHRYTSLWGYYTRFNEGLVSVSIFFGLYLCGMNTLKKEDLESLLRLVLWGSLLVSCFGIWQYAQGISRVYSTIGQSNWLAQYYVLVLPFVISLYLMSKRVLNIWFVVYLLGFACLWFTYSVSGLLGFGVGFVFVLIHHLKNSNKFVLYRLGIILGISIVIAAFFPGIMTQKVHDGLFGIKTLLSLSVENVYALETSYKVSDPSYIRLALWHSSAGIIVSSPKNLLIGTGPETFPYVYQKYRSSLLNHSSEWNFVFNKPHNYYLEVFIESGLFGIVSYLGLLWYVCKKVPRGVLPSFFGLLVTNIFGWPTVVPTLFFWLFIVFSEYAWKK